MASRLNHQKATVPALALSLLMHIGALLLWDREEERPPLRVWLQAPAVDNRAPQLPVGVKQHKTANSPPSAEAKQKASELLSPHKEATLKSLLNPRSDLYSPNRPFEERVW